MVAPLRSRGAELDFWSSLQRQHSVLCVLGVSGLNPSRIPYYYKCYL